VTRVATSIILLDIVYLLTLDSAHPWDIAIGALLAACVYALFGAWVFPLTTDGKPLPAVPLWSRLLHAPAFVLAETVNITRGTWNVMLVVLRLRPYRQGIVGVPFGERSEPGLVVMSYADTLSPGSVIVDIDEERATVWTHYIDAADPDGNREDAHEFYERWQRKVVP
jgi:multisubunit Na+/H+ antiporter MnhE subunit